MTTIDLNTATKSEMMAIIALEPSLKQWINEGQSQEDMRKNFQMWLNLNALTL